MYLRFDSILPEEIPQYAGNIIFTTSQESSQDCRAVIITEDEFDPHPTMIRGLLVQTLDNSFEEPYLVLGVDPGKQIGLSVSYHGCEIESSIHSSVDDLISHMIPILGRLRASRKIVKIGNGDMQMYDQIKSQLNLRYCSSFEIHLVDERHTSFKIKNHNQRGKRDMLSARFISRREGVPKHILPLSMIG